MRDAQAAINGGYSEIFLVSDEYFISSVAAKNLVATIRGRVETQYQSYGG